MSINTLVLDLGDVSTTAYLKQAKELYILQGEIRLDQSTQVQSSLLKVSQF